MPIAYQSNNLFSKVFLPETSTNIIYYLNTMCPCSQYQYSCRYTGQEKRLTHTLHQYRDYQLHIYQLVHSYTKWSLEYIHPNMIFHTLIKKRRVRRQFIKQCNTHRNSWCPCSQYQYSCRYTGQEKRLTHTLHQYRDYQLHICHLIDNYTWQNLVYIHQHNPNQKAHTLCINKAF